MNLSWNNRVIKYVLFVFNLIFVITGIIMMAVGVSVKASYTDYDIFLNDSYFSLPNLLIAIGSLILFISFFGCCGAIRENWFMIFIFSVLLSIIFIMELSAGIAGYVLRDKTVDYLTDSLQQTMINYQSHTNRETDLWDDIQRNFECCGVKNASDWSYLVTTTTVSTSTVVSTTSPVTSPETKSTDTTTAATSTKSGDKLINLALVSETYDYGDLPSSCCKINNGVIGTIHCNLNNNKTATYYEIGCLESFGNYLKEHAVTLGGVGIAIALIQLFGVIFACHLTKQLKNGFYTT